MDAEHANHRPLAGGIGRPARLYARRQHRIGFPHLLQEGTRIELGRRLRRRQHLHQGGGPDAAMQLPADLHPRHPSVELQQEGERRHPAVALGQHHALPGRLRAQLRQVRPIGEGRFGRIGRAGRGCPQRVGQPLGQPGRLGKLARQPGEVTGLAQPAQPPDLPQRRARLPLAGIQRPVQGCQRRLDAPIQQPPAPLIRRQALLWVRSLSSAIVLARPARRYRRRARLPHHHFPEPAGTPHAASPPAAAVRTGPDGGGRAGHGPLPAGDRLPVLGRRRPAGGRPGGPRHAAHPGRGRAGGGHHRPGRHRGRAGDGRELHRRADRADGRRRQRPGGIRARPRPPGADRPGLPRAPRRPPPGGRHRHRHRRRGDRRRRPAAGQAGRDPAGGRHHRRRRRDPGRIRPHRRAAAGHPRRRPRRRTAPTPPWSAWSSRPRASARQ